MIARIIALVLIVSSLFFILSSLYLFWLQVAPKTYAAHASHQKMVAGHYPQELRIPSLAIDLAIFPGSPSAHGWNTSAKGVSFATTSVLPGENGNSIIYGHDWPSLLGKIKQIQLGQKVQIIYSDATTKTFTVIDTYDKPVNQIYTLDQVEKQQLTIYTCSGLFDSKRFFVIAKLDK